MSFDCCPVCLNKANGPFVGIGVRMFPNGQFGIGAMNSNNEVCCTIQSGIKTREAAEASAKTAEKDREDIENDNRDAAAMYADDGDYGPADSDPYGY